MSLRYRAVAAVAWWLPGLLTAQAPASVPGDSLGLRSLHVAARRVDPRQRQLMLQATQSELRQRNLATERNPSLTVESFAQYQSDVVRLPVPLVGVRPPVPPHDTYDAHVIAKESLFDPTRAPRRAAETAQLRESQSQVRTTLFSLTEEVDEAFFTAALLEARAVEVRATIADLAARRREAAVRVREGASLPSDTAALDATILERREDESELRANRRAALARLALLTSRAIDDSATAVLPDLVAAVADARARLDDVHARPEYAQFTATRQHLATQSEVVAARDRPNVSAFVRAGYGKPGLNFLSNQFATYWIAGVQMQWTPVTWGTVAREREVLTLQQQIVASNETAFTETLRRGVQTDLATIDRIESTLTADARIITLREQVERETRLRLQEGVVTAADYLVRNNELLQARLARATHRVELAQARTHLLTTLGIEVP